MAFEHAVPDPAARGEDFIAAGGAVRDDLTDMFAEYFCKRPPVHLKLLLDAIEKCLILKVLDRASGNQKEAARILGIKYTTLNQKVKKHGIRIRRGRPL